ncbi:MAG: protein kinase [Fibrobacter sp.]|nr:protein kinase [Fibrobacter sp.]
MNITSGHFLPGTNKQLGNKYLLLECFGDGSHGWVWRAERLQDKTIVAVKIPKDLTKDDRVLAEGKELLHIENHPNIVHIYDMGRIPPDNEWFFIEMEYFPSRSLAQKLEQRSQNFGNTYERLFNIYEQVLNAVEFLASLQTPISHGDIKPHNILVGNGDLVKLTDFGSSALPEEIYVRTRENGGTVLYAAPEYSECTSRKGSFNELLSGDIYSLGVLLYQLLTGQLPHETPAQVRRHAPFKKPSEINSTIVPALDNLVLRCLAKMPSDRFRDIKSLKTAFETARKAQQNNPMPAILDTKVQTDDDWSVTVVNALQKQDYLSAAKVAKAEFQRSHDSGALLQHLNALFRANRLFEFQDVFEREYPVINVADSSAGTIRILAVKMYLSLRELERARELLAVCRDVDGESLEHDFLRATIYGMEANFFAARKELENINRKAPGKSQILMRLIQVCEQMRDYEAASSYLRHALRFFGDDVEFTAKKGYYQNLGLL